MALLAGRHAVSIVGRSGQRYAHLSDTHPHLVAAATAGSVIGTADLSCQFFFQRDAEHGIDWRPAADGGAHAVRLLSGLLAVVTRRTAPVG